MKASTSVLILAGMLTLMSCQKEESVATVGSERILASEFKERYEAYLLSQPESRDNILVRKEILNNMINERLIFQHLHAMGLDDDEIARREKERVTELALLDAYGRSVSTDTMDVPEHELYDEFRKSNSKARVRYLYARTKEGALELKARLDRGATFQNLAPEVFEDPGLAHNGGDLGYIGHGEMEPEMEEVAFSAPVGDVSDPVRLSMGYALIKVEARVEAPLASEYDYARKKEALARSVVEKKSIRYVTAAAHRVSAELDPHFNEVALAHMKNRWSTISGSAEPRIEKPIEGMENLSSLNLVSFQNGTSWTIGDFLEKLNVTTSRQQQKVQTLENLREFIRGLAVREVLLSRARAEGLENRPEVQTQIEKQRVAFLLKRFRSLVEDTVGRNGWPDDALRAQFIQRKHELQYPPEVNVAEILVRTKEEAENIRTLLARGEKFAELARNHSIRLWAAKNGGELGFGTRSTFGILGDRFFVAHPGEIIGPEFVDPYYGIFRVLEKRDGRTMTYDEAKHRLGEGMALVAKQKAMKSAITGLRQHISHDMDVEGLANVVIERHRSN